MVARTNTTRPLVAIVGPTASGKTGLAVDIALKFNGEIISADSWLVRRGLDIGTAKPSQNLRKLVPHHLIDIINPEEDFSAAAYKVLAEDEIAAVMERGRLPILVGGTGLYVDSVLFNFSFLPAGDQYERRRLNQQSLESLLAEAKKKGIDLSAIDIRNKRRIIRAIETNGGIATKGHIRPNTLIVGLWAEKTQLQLTICERVQRMLEDGLMEEVAGLVHEYGWGCEGLKGIGYSEWKEYFAGTQTLAITTERIIKDTLELAKRQQTWLKRNKSIQWYPTPVNVAAVEALITTFLNKSGTA